MFNFGKSLLTMAPEEQKNMLDNAPPAQRRTAHEMGVGMQNTTAQQERDRQLAKRREATTDLDRLNHVVERENEAHDFFGNALGSWQKNVTGKAPGKDAQGLKKQFDDFEHGLLSQVPEGGKRHGALADSLPKIKDSFLKQGHQFAMDKLNEHSRNILDQGLQRIAKGAFGATDEKDTQAHDDAAFDLINKYVMSEAKFDEKDADAMFDKYLGYAGAKSEPARKELHGDAPAQPEKEAVAFDGRDVEPNKNQGKEAVTPIKDELISSTRDAREMEEKAAESKSKNSTECARMIEEWERQTGNSTKEVEEHYKQKPGPKPTWIKDELGTSAYYEKCAKDFEERNPGKKAPSYYREYGDKYVKRFDKLKPELSKEGQEWLERTKDLLQFKMESGLRSGEWDESKPEELKEKAYDSHSEAYLEAGLADLPQEDIEKILTTVDRDDFFTWDAMVESGETASKVPLGKTIQSIPTALKWLITGPSITDEDK